MMQSRNLYPLTSTLPIRGLLAGGIASVLLGSLVLGFAVWAVFCMIGLLWRSDQMPILPFCILYQWLFVVTGFTVYLMTGNYPGQPWLGSIELAVFYSTLGLLSLAAGFRLATSQVGIGGAWSAPAEYDLRRLFWLVVILFTIDWFIELNLLNIPYQYLHPIRVLLKLRYLFLFLLLIEVERSNSGYQIAVAAFALSILPKLLTGMSSFKEPIFFLSILLASRYVPHATTLTQKRRNRRILMGAGLITVVLMGVGLVWNQDLKLRWRMALWRGEVVGSPVEKIGVFGDMLSDSLSRFDLEKASEGFTSRMSSGVAYFSHVVDRVPSFLPHEQGLLIGRGIKHVLTPRFLFPDKPNLGGDSWIVRKYAGLWVSGTEQGTSVGLGYIGEFYIDYGLLGILFFALLFGAYNGLLYRLIWRYSPSAQLAAAFSVVLLLDYFTGYESNFAKTLGGVTQTFLIYMALILVAGPTLNRYLVRGVPSAADKPLSTDPRATQQ